MEMKIKVLYVSIAFASPVPALPSSPTVGARALSSGTLAGLTTMVGRGMASGSKAIASLVMLFGGHEERGSSPGVMGHCRGCEY